MEQTKLKRREKLPAWKEKYLGVSGQRVLSSEDDSRVSATFIRLCGLCLRWKGELQQITAARFELLSFDSSHQAKAVRRLLLDRLDNYGVHLTVSITSE